jgi:hypothetical protein
MIIAPEKVADGFLLTWGLCVGAIMIAGTVKFVIYIFLKDWD